MTNLLCIIAITGIVIAAWIVILKAEKTRHDDDVSFNWWVPIEEEFGDDFSE